MVVAVEWLHSEVLEARARELGRSSARSLARAYTSSRERGRCAHSIAMCIHGHANFKQCGKCVACRSRPCKCTSYCYPIVGDVT